MKTLVADDRSRVKIPDAKPGQVFAYAQANGILTLTPVKKAERKERFPRGGLLKYLNAERDERDTAIARSTIIGVPKRFREEAGDK